MADDTIQNLISTGSWAAQTHATPRKTGAQAANVSGSPNFADVLRSVGNSAVPSLKVSAHAAARLRDRGVHMSNADWQNVGAAVDRASQKGARDAYVMYGQHGFVVNVANRTVITAMNQQEETVVTNVDSVVVIPKLDR